MIEFGLLDQLKELNWKVKFDGHRDYAQMRPASDPPVGKLLNARYVSTVTQSVAGSVAAHLKEGSLALTLGGDHSIALGTVAGTMSVHPDAALIWIDAHAVSENCLLSTILFVQQNRKSDIINTLRSYLILKNEYIISDPRISTHQKPPTVVTSMVVPSRSSWALQDRSRNSVGSSPV